MAAEPTGGCVRMGLPGIGERHDRTQIREPRSFRWKSARQDRDMNPVLRFAKRPPIAY